VKVDVLHVIPDLGIGGAERIASTLARRAADAGLGAGICCLGPRRDSLFETQAAAAGVPLVFLDKPRGARPAWALRVAQAISRSGARLVHTHLHVAPYVLPALALLPIRSVHTVHNLAGRELGLLGAVAQRLAYALGTIPVAVAHAVGASVERRYGVRNVTVIPNGVPIPRQLMAPADRDRPRAALGLAPDDVVLAFVGRLAPQKDPALLLEAFAASVAAKHPRAALLFVGDGPLRRPLQERAQALGIAARVLFAGVRRDARELLEAVDVLVLPSGWEGSPMSVLEAMAAGKAVVATAVGGVPELIEDGRTGLLVPAGDIAHLGAALERLCIDSQSRARLGQAAQIHVRERFDEDSMARAYIHLYQQLLEGRGRSAAHA
jgi:glycosyltransferase involved in cell wall biosynthesis